MTKEKNLSFVGLKTLIEEEYFIKYKLDSTNNLQENTIMEIIHQVLGKLVHMHNIQETYVDDADPWMKIIAAAAFVVQPRYRRNNYKIPGKLFYG